jgi:RNA polymerase sigma-70 factor (ECF subfamily)
MTMEQAQSEQSLVLALKSGNKAAIARLYDSYSAALYGIISRIVGSENLAEEALQDTFVKIWNNIESYDAGKGTLFTWMRRIAHNTSIDMLRQKDRQVGGVALDGNEVHIDAQFQNSIAVDTIGVRHLLERLRPEYQQVIDMLYFQGYTQQEVSDELNIPLGTVKTRTRAALNDLRKLFATIIVLLLILSWLS